MENNDNNTVIAIENMSFGYSSGQTILENVNLNVAKGDSACIVGPNGGGKTTLLKIMLGLLVPDSGTVKILGEAPADVRRKIGYVPQYSAFDPLFPVSVMDVVLMGRLERHLFFSYSKKDKMAAMEALDEIKAVDLRKRKFSELSGGQRQRVLIARALVSDPALMLLDEPTANVDPVMEEKIFETLQNLNKRLTILTVSHDLSFVSSVFRSVICVNRKLAKHHTVELSGDLIKNLYGRNIRVVHHLHDELDCRSKADSESREKEI